MTVKVKNDINTSVALQKYAWGKVYRFYYIIIGIFVAIAYLRYSTVGYISLFYIFFPLILILYIVIVPIVTKKSLKKNRFIGDNVINEFTFNETSLTVHTTRDGVEIGSNVLPKDDVKKVIDYKGYLFLFLTSRQAFGIDKTGLTEEELSTIRRFAGQDKFK
jgi:uncharacterized membrane protein